jgi:hypothetical protein
MSTLKNKLYTLTLIALPLVFNNQSMYAQDFIVTGKANNAKLGAVVVTEANEVYYIDKLEFWNSDFIDKTVKVTGKLIIKKTKKTNLISGSVASPSIKLIKRPRIEVMHQ